MSSRRQPGRGRGVLLAVLLLGSTSAGAAGDLTIVDATLLAAPHAEPVEGATIEIRAGRIHAISTGDATGSGAVLDVGGRVVTAGLWNCHVHFTDPALAEDAAGVLRDMLLAYGFTSVLDTGADPAVLGPLRRAVESRELTGPRIVVAGGSFVAKGGTPVYLPGIRLPELLTPQAAAPAVNAVLDAGADGIKLFSGSFMGPGEPTVLLAPAIIRAVADAAHARSSFVVAHPTDREGLANAVLNGVDVLAHTAPPAGPLGDELVAAMRAGRVALIPTLKLWAYEARRSGAAEEVVQAFQGSGVSQLAEYFAAGGEILFGTDVGYMRDWDPGEEFALMARAGLDFDALLASLTTHPARRFAGESGTVRPGERADLVVYARDPREDATAFARVFAAVRGGEVAFREPAGVAR